MSETIPTRQWPDNQRPIAKVTTVRNQIHIHFGTPEQFNAFKTFLNGERNPNGYWKWWEVGPCEKYIFRQHIVDVEIEWHETQKENRPPWEANRTC